MQNSASTHSGTFFIWLIAIFITLGSVVYQRITGPTYAIRGHMAIDNHDIKFRLPRTNNSTSDAEIKIIVPDASIKGRIKWKRFKSYDEWLTEDFKNNSDTLLTYIPKQPAAGKVIYEISLIDKNGKAHELTQNSVIIRFKDPVPALVLIPHIIGMFAAMLLSTRTGLEALCGRINTYRLTVWTAILMFAGGLIFGPIVQKFAFGAFWTGWPFGHDLTDSKTAFAMIFWLIALWQGRKAKRLRTWAIIASVVTLIIFLIPHSVLGSELDHMKN